MTYLQENTFADTSSAYSHSLSLFRLLSITDIDHLSAISIAYLASRMDGARLRPGLKPSPSHDIVVRTMIPMTPNDRQSMTRITIQ